MSIYGCSFAEYADKYSKSALKATKYLSFRDIPDLLQKYANGNTLLDYGCGPGISSAFLKKLGFQIDGVDINESMINLARQALPKNNFQVLEKGNIPAEDEHYDIVFSSWVLQDIGYKHELVTTLIEIARVLKTDGIFVAVLASEAFYGKNWIDLDAKYKENENLKSGDETKILIKETNFVLRPYFWTEKDYREVLQEAGFDVMLVNHPLGKDDDEIAWVNEKTVSPVTIYIAKKSNF